MRELLTMRPPSHALRIDIFRPRNRPSAKMTGRRPINASDFRVLPNASDYVNRNHQKAAKIPEMRLPIWQISFRFTSEYFRLVPATMAVSLPRDREFRPADDGPVSETGPPGGRQAVAKARANRLVFDTPTYPWPARPLSTRQRNRLRADRRCRGLSEASGPRRHAGLPA